MTRAALSVVSLTAIYALMLASVDPVDLAMGAGISIALVIGLRGFLYPDGLEPVPGIGRRLIGSARLAVTVARDVTVGTWQVAAVVLGLRPLRSPGIVELPVDDRSDLAAVVASLGATLSPGEFVVDFDWERRVVLMHLLDASDPEGARERWREGYERYQRQVIP